MDGDNGCRTTVLNTIYLKMVKIVNSMFYLFYQF